MHHDVERTVGVVSTRLERALHVLDPQHRAAHDRSEVVLHRVRAEAPSVGVDERELERIVRVDLELDLGDLVAHRTERAQERLTREVVVGDELVDRERGRGMRLPLAQLERDVPSVGDEEVTTLAREMTIPERVRPREPAARPRGRANVCPHHEVLVLASHTADARSRERSPRRRDRVRLDREPLSRARRAVAETRVEALPERVEHRHGVAPDVGRDVEVLEERGRDPLPPDLGSDRERRDGPDPHGAAPEPGLQREEEGLADDVVAAEREDEVGEASERICRKIAPSLGGRALVGEGREVQLEDRIDVVGRGGAETQVLGAHGSSRIRSPQSGPFEVEDVRPEAMATEHAHSGQTGLRLGGARADFVAGLGRKVSDLRTSSSKVREAPADFLRREELRRKMNALSSAAKLMKFDAMERSLSEALGTIDRTDLDVPMEPVDLDAIDQVIEDLPALAWGDGDARVSRVEPVAKPAMPTYSALVVGSPHIAKALLDTPAETADGPSTNLQFTCESTPDAQAAFDLARTTEPDLVVLDADLEYAVELVEALMDDPITEAAPLVVVGSFQEPGEESRYVAMGVVKTLTKPTSKATLRAACEKALESRAASFPRVAVVGSPSSAPPSDQPHGDRARVRLRGPAAEVRLQGRRVVIADDDPAVVWFLADLLKTSGCIVHEAFDGKQALELAYRTSPDLLICDIMMPEIDGFALCRMLQRDVALHDVPVILLSWKEDLLQRVRELGAGAAGYVRKESDTRAIVARIREALRPRSRIETRLRDDGEVRGRMDGISVRTLLEIVCATRPEARVSVRDASFNYEIEVRDGAPQRATRTSGDGTFLEGSRVIAAMLGVGAGRFTVTTSTAKLDTQLDGNLSAQLAKPIARARAATALLTGAGTMKVSHVLLDEDMLDDYLKAMPEQARKVAQRIGNGTSPRALVLEGACAASLVEDIVCDLASRGIVKGIEDDMGEDLLGPEVARLAAHGDTRASFAPHTATPEPMATGAGVEGVAKLATNDCANDTGNALCESPEPSDVGSGARAGDGSLEDAVMNELALCSPEPAQLGLPIEASASAPIVVKAPYEDEGTPTHDQILAMAEATVVENTTYAEREAELGERPEASIPIDEVSRPMSSESRSMKTPLTAVTSRDEEAAGLPTKSKSRAWPMVAFMAASGIVAWAVLHFSAAPTAPKAVEVAPPAPPAPPAQTVATKKEGEVTYTTPAVESDVATGHGLLEISAPGDAVILVDGTERGRGGATLPLWAGVHDVRISGAQGEPHRAVEVRAAKIAHIKF